MVPPMTLSHDIPEELGEAINRIGVQALAVAGDPDARLLFYVEVHPGMDHMIFRHASPGEEKLRCAEESDELVEAMREAWDICNQAGVPWRAMVYFIENQAMKVELLYDEQVSEALTMYEKEEALLDKYFPGMEVVPVDLPGAVQLSLRSPRPFWKIWG